MKKKYISLIFIFYSVFSGFSIFAERPLSFTLHFSPTFILNSDNPKNSESFPVAVPISFGIVIPNRSFVSFQPRLSFFSNYYFLTEKGAYPAENDSKTATAFSFLLDLPASLTFTAEEKHSFELSAGLSFLMRFATLSHGIKENDSGFNGITAKQELSEINKYFWKDAHFLYVSTGFSYLYSISKKISAGPEIQFYLPCGQIFSGNGMNEAMFTIGMKTKF